MARRVDDRRGELHDVVPREGLVGEDQVVAPAVRPVSAEAGAAPATGASTVLVPSVVPPSGASCRPVVVVPSAVVAVASVAGTVAPVAAAAASVCTW